jgi:SAM-dependent methyltransferase
MADSRWWKDFDQVVAALQPAGSRVLDVGCGDGGLVDRLGQFGFDAIGVDPAAPAHPRLIRESVEQVTELSKVDAVVAVMALHHAELDAVTSAIAGLVRPHGRLFVYDFDWSAYDDRAAAWLVPRDPSGADNSLSGWRREHNDLHQGMTIKDALGAEFTVPFVEVRRPYLARMLGRPDLEAAEHALIDAQMLPALGFWLIDTCRCQRRARHNDRSALPARARPGPSGRARTAGRRAFSLASLVTQGDAVNRSSPRLSLGRPSATSPLEVAVARRPKGRRGRLPHA